MLIILILKSLSCRLHIDDSWNFITHSWVRLNSERSEQSRINSWRESNTSRPLPRWNKWEMNFAVTSPFPCYIWYPPGSINPHWCFPDFVSRTKTKLKECFCQIKGQNLCLHVEALTVLIALLCLIVLLDARCILLTTTQVKKKGTYLPSYNFSKISFFALLPG